MSSIREDILTTIKTVLDATGGGVNGRVFRSRVYSFDRASVPALIIRPVGDIADNDITNFTNWTLTIEISIVVRGDIPDTIADPIVESVHNLLLTDETLRAKVLDIQASSVNFEMQEGDEPAGVISLGYNIFYRTSVFDLST